jgi:acyl dehydratase
MPDLYFEDLRPGDVTTFGGVTVERDAMVAFAERYDPQPFHVDEEQARDTFVGQLIASGWYTTALVMRMACDAWVLRSSSRGAPGVEELRWLKPVLAGDRLSVRQSVLGAKTSRSRPEMGLAHLQWETLNGEGEVVMVQTNWTMLGRREPGAAAEGAKQAEAAGGGATATGATAQRERPDSAEAGSARGYFDSLTIGATDDLGSHHFTAEDIIGFARNYDPQPFHIDEAAGRASPYGGLVASGWQTAACWMRGLVEHRKALVAEAKANGVPAPRFGPSPGFKKLRWLKPVRVGDTIRYSTTLTDKRRSGSRPGWGITFSTNEGHNQHGELVYSFEGSGFVALD